jgi:hypothetical protein
MIRVVIRRRCQVTRLQIAISPGLLFAVNRTTEAPLQTQAVQLASARLGPRCFTTGRRHLRSGGTIDQPLSQLLLEGQPPVALGVQGYSMRPVASRLISNLSLLTFAVTAIV